MVQQQRQKQKGNVCLNRVQQPCEYKRGADLRFDGRMVYSAKVTGRVGLLALSRGWRNGADIRPCVDHETALGLIVDDEKDTAGGGVPGEVVSITPWWDGFPTRNRVVGTSWRGHRSWCDRSTNNWRLRQSGVWIVAGGNKRLSVVGHYITCMYTLHLV